MDKYIALGVYFVILGIITYFSSRRKNDNDFLVASRNVGWLNIGIAIFAASISSYNLVLGITFSYLFGPWVILVYVGVLLAFIGIYYLVKTQKSEIIIGEKFITIIDFIADKFGTRNATVMNFALMITLFVFLALNFFVNTTVVSKIFGWDKYTSSILVGVVVLLYTLVGGLKVSILTDVFQGILMLMFGGLVFLVDTSKITFASFQPLLTDQTIIIGAVSLMISQFLTMLTWPEIWQRVYATKSLPDLKKGFALSWFLLLVILIPEILIGLTARATGGISDPSNLFYDILATSTPGWFLPFLSIALLAAFMSTLDASLFALGTQLGKYGLRVKPDAPSDNDDKQIVKRTRIAIIIVTILSLVLSLYFSNFLIAVFQLASLATVISTVLVLSVILKTKNNETLLGLCVGIITFLCAAFGGLITAVPYTSLYPSGFIVLFMLIQNIIYRNIKSWNRA